MGTAAGFFGITYQGAVNGLASITLSIFNLVRARTHRGRKPTPDHCRILARARRTTPTTGRG